MNDLLKESKLGKVSEIFFILLLVTKEVAHKIAKDSSKSSLPRIQLNVSFTKAKQIP